MNEEQTELFEQELKKELEKARLQGMAIGCKSVSKVIYEKLINAGRNSTKNDLIRVIKDIKKFFETGLGINIENVSKSLDDVDDVDTDENLEQEKGE